MLHIYTIDKTSDIDLADQNIVIDADLEFKRLKTQNNEYNRQMVEEIDAGDLLDNDSFIDRFGDKRSTDDLSTGCKVAILIAAYPDKKILAIECGMNALTEIVKYCTVGNIIIYTPENGIINYELEDCRVDILLDSYRFTSLDRLNYYLTDERPFKPDMGMEGIEDARI